MNIYINSQLKRITMLGEALWLTSSLALYRKGVVLGVCQVAAPQFDVTTSEVVTHVGTQEHILFLTEGVSLIPLSITLSCQVSTYEDMLEAVVGAQREGC